jgi:hypothetical protein
MFMPNELVTDSDCEITRFNDPAPVRTEEAEFVAAGLEIVMAQMQ